MRHYLVEFVYDDDFECAAILAKNPDDALFKLDTSVVGQAMEIAEFEKVVISVKAKSEESLFEDESLITIWI